MSILTIAEIGCNVLVDMPVNTSATSATSEVVQWVVIVDIVVVIWADSQNYRISSWINLIPLTRRLKLQHHTPSVCVQPYPHLYLSSYLISLTLSLIFILISYIHLTSYLCPLSIISLCKHLINPHLLNPLGRITLGNMSLLLPSVIKAISTQKKNQYLLLHSLREMISCSLECKVPLDKYINPIWLEQHYYILENIYIYNYIF